MSNINNRNRSFRIQKRNITKYFLLSLLSIILGACSLYQSEAHKKLEAEAFTFAEELRAANPSLFSNCQPMFLESEDLNLERQPETKDSRLKKYKVFYNQTPYVENKTPQLFVRFYYENENHFIQCLAFPNISQINYIQEPNYENL